MTIAEIHGKISSSGSNLSDRVEDLLTSDVFGPLRYLPFTEGLLPILGEAQLYSHRETKLKDSFPDGMYEAEVQFWPWTGSSEPDVLIKCRNHLLMIEAKYLSGKSGEQEDSNEVTDQLAREFLDLWDTSGKFSNKEFPKKSLIYLTAHVILPKDDIEEGYDEIHSNRRNCADFYEKNTYWLSWYDVHKTIDKLLNEEKNSHKKLILKDIKDLLYRKGLRMFQGFAELGIQQDDVYSVSGMVFYQQRGFQGFTKTGIQQNEVNPVSEMIFYQRNT